MRRGSCRACGKPCQGGVCAGCKEAASYADPEYRRNRGEMMRAAAAAYAEGRVAVCAICGKRIIGLANISIEHLVPLRRGGTHCRSNLDYAHLACNSAMKPKAGPLTYRRPLCFASCSAWCAASAGSSWAPTARAARADLGSSGVLPWQALAGSPKPSQISSWSRREASVTCKHNWVVSSMTRSGGWVTTISMCTKCPETKTESKPA